MDTAQQHAYTVTRRREGILSNRDEGWTVGERVVVVRTREVGIVREVQPERGERWHRVEPPIDARDPVASQPVTPPVRSAGGWYLTGELEPG
jgi:hypothetical protein